MIKLSRRSILAIAILSLAISVPFSGNCQEEGKTAASQDNGVPEKRLNPTLEKGIGLYKHENYDEALGVLKKARLEEPQSTLAAYYLGLTYKQMQDYNSAVPHLRDAVTMSPKIKGALIELIDCLYQIGGARGSR